MTWYSMKMKAEKKARIDIYDVIGKDWYGDGKTVEAKKFISQLKDLGELAEIDLHINSPGGDVFEGTAIYNELRRHSAHITAYIDGLAASMASIIAMAADKVVMPNNALMMIHDPSTVAWGNAEAMRKVIDRLEKVKEAAISAYETKTGLSRDEISEMMTAETWMTAENALEKGFADEIEDAVKMAACFDLAGKFKNAPVNFFPKNTAFIENKSQSVDLEASDESITDSSVCPSSLPGDTPVLTLEVLKQDHPEIYNQVMAEGAAVERDRIQGVLNAALPGHEKMVNELAFDGKTSVGEAAMKVLEAQKVKMQAANTEFKEQAPQPVAVSTDGVITEDDDSSLPKNFDSLSLEEQCKVRWEKDADIRQQYHNVFEAYHTAEKYSGKTRVYGK